jgi:hypothetical protein
MSSNVRQEYLTAKARKAKGAEFIDFIDSARYYPDVFQRMINKIKSVLDESDPKLGNVLSKGHF